jgi:DNA polymerase III subunit beta
MKLVIERDAFIKSLGKVQGIVEKRNAMPILSNALLRASEANLEIVATDLEVTVMDKCPVDLHTEGKLTLNAKKLYDIVRELPDGPVSLTASADYHVEVKSGKVRFELMGMGADEYPKIPDPDEFKFIEMPAKLMLGMVEKTIYATVGEEARFSLNGVFTEKTEDGKGLRMVATDGHRLAMVERELPAVPALDKGIIMPRKGMSEVMKLIPEVEGNIGLAIKEKMAAFRTNDTILIMRLVDGKFPDYRKVIIEGADKKAVISSEELLRNLRRVSLMVDEKARAVKFSFEKNLLKLESKNPNFGSSYSELEIEYSGTDINIGFNDRYFVDIIGAAKCAKVEISLRDEQSPALITVAEDKDYTCVIMPMRL